MRLTARARRDRRSAIVALSAALGLAAAACSDEGFSMGTTSAPTATSTTPAAATTDGDDHIAEQVDVDGRSLYLECRGTGSPTVVLHSGYGNAGDRWHLSESTTPAVFPALAETNRVCTYDRPGSAISTTNANGTVAQIRCGRAAAAVRRRPPVTPSR
jgi:pimeloyl-ACP methyl ester carboxylesterase